MSPAANAIRFSTPLKRWSKSACRPCCRTLPLPRRKQVHKLSCRRPRKRSNRRPRYWPPNPRPQAPKRLLPRLRLRPRANRRQRRQTNHRHRHRSRPQRRHSHRLRLAALPTLRYPANRTPEFCPATLPLQALRRALQRRHRNQRVTRKRRPHDRHQRPRSTTILRRVPCQQRHSHRQ